VIISSIKPEDMQIATTITKEEWEEIVQKEEGPCTIL